MTQQWMFPNYVKTLDRASKYLFSQYGGVIIFDIDDTLILQPENKTIPETIFFYDLTKNMGFTPVIITARPGFSENVDRTIEELKSFGITGFEYIFFMPNGEKDPYRYKLNARKNVYDIYGGNIVMSVGDMPWDVGQYGGYSVLLQK